MKRFYILAMAFVLLAMTSSQAMAQRGGFMRMMGGGQELDSTLLAMTEVQDELNFTDEQKEEIGDQAQEILDADHFGLEKVKKRIIEFLAVRKLKGDLKPKISLL